MVLAKCIEIYDNRKRRHSSLGYRTPLQALTDHQAAPAGMMNTRETCPGSAAHSTGRSVVLPGRTPRSAPTSND